MQLYVHHMVVSKRFAHQGPKAQRLCKLRRDRTDTMGYASTYPRPSNYSVGCKRLEHVPSNSSNNILLRVPAERCRSNTTYARRRGSRADAVYCPTPAPFLTFRTAVLQSLCRIDWSNSRSATRRSQLLLLLVHLLTWRSIAPPTNNAVRHARELCRIVPLYQLDIIIPIWIYYFRVYT